MTDHTPLRPVEFQILLSLAGGDRHGYGIILDTEERTDGSVRLDVATLYRAIRRMEDRELLAPSGTDSGDRRRREYTITPEGRRVAQAEARRLADLVRVARGAELLDGVEPA